MVAVHQVTKQVRTAPLPVLVAVDAVPLLMIMSVMIRGDINDGEGGGKSEFEDQPQLNISCLLIFSLSFCFIS